MFDVQKSGIEVLKRIISENKGKNIVIRELIFNDKIIISEKIKSPDVFKLVFEEKELKNIEYIDWEK